MNKLSRITLLLSVLAIACGGADEANAEGTSGGEHAHHHEHDGEHHAHAHDDGHHEGGHHEHGEHHHEHPEMAPALQAFHDAFAAHWHGDRSGPAVCPDAANLQALAQAAADEHGDEAQSEEARVSAQLVVDTCAADPASAEFEANFDRFHHALHAMMGVPID